MRSMPGNPYDGHTLAQTLAQVSILAERKPTTAIVDKGYGGVEIEGVRILRSGQKRGITPTLKAMIHRRSAIEPAGHNLRLILAALRLYCARADLSLPGVLASVLQLLRIQSSASA